MTYSAQSFLKVFLVTAIIITVSAATGWGASVSLRWDPNDPTPEGYRLFAREDAQSYTYTKPIRTTGQTSQTLIGLTEGVTYCFVVRAFEGSLESLDSDEVCYTPPVAQKTADNDPAAESESGSAVGSGSGQAGQGSGQTTPQAEQSAVAGSEPVDEGGTGSVDVGADDPDPARADSDSVAVDYDTTANGPVVISPADGDTGLLLTPMLLCDGNWDDHVQTRWQISTKPCFSKLVLEETSQTQLLDYAVGDLILDVDSQYYWRVQFIDGRGSRSDWSEPGIFRTLLQEASDDTTGSGIPDLQEVGCLADMNNNGIPDCEEATILSFYGADGKTVIGVETLSEGARLVAARSLPFEPEAGSSVRMQIGLVGFKLYLDDGVTTATVAAHFSRPASKHAQVFKYNPDTGRHEVFEQALFSRNRRSVTLTLEDGGPGDEDGVKNGVIVDPFGIGYVVDPLVTQSASLSTGESEPGVAVNSASCFIATATRGTFGPDTVLARATGWPALLLLVAGLVGCAAFSTRKRV